MLTTVDLPTNVSESELVHLRAPYEFNACGKTALLRRQRSEQYTTSSQFLAHFLRQENGLAHTTQILVSSLNLNPCISCPHAYSNYYLLKLVIWRTIPNF